RSISHPSGLPDANMVAAPGGEAPSALCAPRGRSAPPDIASRCPSAFSYRDFGLTRFCRSRPHRYAKSRRSLLPSPQISGSSWCFLARHALASCSGVLPHYGGVHRSAGTILFRRRDDGLESKRLEPELPAPARGMREMLVFLVLDLRARFGESAPGGAVQYRGAFAEQFPVGSIRRLGEHDTLASDQFRCRS